MAPFAALACPARAEKPSFLLRVVSSFDLILPRTAANPLSRAFADVHVEASAHRSALPSLHRCGRRVAAVATCDRPRPAQRVRQHLQTRQQKRSLAPVGELHPPARVAAGAVEAGGDVHGLLRRLWLADPPERLHAIPPYAASRRRRRPRKRVHVLLLLAVRVRHAGLYTSRHCQRHARGRGGASAFLSPLCSCLSVFREPPKHSGRQREATAQPPSLPRPARSAATTGRWSATRATTRPSCASPSCSPSTAAARHRGIRLDGAPRLRRAFSEPSSLGETTLEREAAEVRCDADGRLIGASLSDHGTR